MDIVNFLLFFDMIENYFAKSFRIFSSCNMVCPKKTIIKMVQQLHKDRNLAVQLHCVKCWVVCETV